MKKFLILAVMAVVGISAGQAEAACKYDQYGRRYCTSSKKKRHSVKKAKKKRYARFRDGQAIQRPSSGTGNDVADQQYEYAPSTSRTIHCTFDTYYGPSSYVRYDADKARLWIGTGWPTEWRRYSGVTERRGLPPFGDNGISVVAFGDVPLVHLQVGYARSWYERFTDYRIEGAWGILPGSSKSGDRGYCYSQQVPKNNWGKNRGNYN